MELAIAYVVLSIVAGVLGRNRRIGFWGFFFCSILVTPILSILFIFFAAPAPSAQVRAAKAAADQAPGASGTAR